MLIFSFDSAVKNLGFCCLALSDKKFTIKYLNTFDLTNGESLAKKPAKKVKNKKNSEELKTDNIEEVNTDNAHRTSDNTSDRREKEVNTPLQKLKYLLYCLVKQLGQPDVVLIEYQMNVNDKSDAISKFIEVYFSPLVKTNITSLLTSQLLTSYDIDNNIILNQNQSTKCIVVKPALKNSINLDTSEAGHYASFISKYATNYTANKAHTTHHLKYYLTKLNLMDFYFPPVNDKKKQFKQKLDDLADAFCMAVTWCALNNYIDENC